ncbi:hypothetical protein [Lishizhenia sp.]|uniref:hypothetical protein n=1 Tax=Lishizhenia sp. TaxID=2497594 RepID=UPI00299EDA9D|nr:hypothetical protein [Lishizhenia sp.]MDX1445144.1 hypothetical protein [Lishizhenia sp.]
MMQNTKSKRIIHYLFLILSLTAAVYLVGYYQSASTMADLRVLPNSVLIAVAIFIVLQLLKRFMFKRMYWFDWLYYFGLIAILLPLLLKFEEGEWLHDVTDFGSLFLVLSPLIGIVMLLLKKEDTI